MKNIKKFLIILFLFPNYNPAYSTEINYTNFIKIFQEFMKDNITYRPINNQTLYQPEEIIIISSINTHEIEKLKTVLIAYLNKNNNDLIIKNIANTFKKVLSKRIETGLDIHNEGDMQKAKKLADAFQQYILLNGENNQNSSWNNIKNIIDEDIKSTKKDKKIMQNLEIKIAGIIKNYITLKTTTSTTTYKLLNELKIFFSESIKNFSTSNIHLVAIDIFNLFISNGEIVATLLAFMLPTQEYFQNLKTLDLSEIGIGDLGITLLSIVIFNKENLTLKLKNNFIGDEGAEKLMAEILPTPIVESHQIQETSLNWCMQPNYHEITNFEEKKPKFFPKKLILADNGIGDIGVDKLAQLLQHAIDNQIHFHLNISGNNVSSNMRDQLAKILRVDDLRKKTEAKFENVSLTIQWERESSNEIEEGIN